MFLAKISGTTSVGDFGLNLATTDFEDEKQSQVLSFDGWYVSVNHEGVFNNT